MLYFSGLLFVHLFFLETQIQDCTLHSCRCYPNFIGLHFWCYLKLTTVLLQPFISCIFQLFSFISICATFAPQQLLQIAGQWGMCLPCCTCILYDSTPCWTSHSFQSPLGYFYIITFQLIIMPMSFSISVITLHSWSLILNVAFEFSLNCPSQSSTPHYSATKTFSSPNSRPLIFTLASNWSFLSPLFSPSLFYSSLSLHELSNVFFLLNERSIFATSSFLILSLQT